MSRIGSVQGARPVRKPPQAVLDSDVTEARDDEHHEDPGSAASSAEDERINDPLTRTDVEARRVPFGSQDAPG
jgi:hypothetical protein